MFILLYKAREFIIAIKYWQLLKMSVLIYG